MDKDLSAVFSVNGVPYGQFVGVDEKEMCKSAMSLTQRLTNKGEVGRWKIFKRGCSIPFRVGVVRRLK